MNYNWNWRIYWESSPDGAGTYMDTLLVGLNWTVATAISAWIMALILGAIIGTLRTVPNRWVVRFGNGYVELFRNIPLLVQMFLWYFVLPELVPTDFGNWLKSMPHSSFVTAVVALGFFTSARVAVQVSAGIQALSGGQKMAGTALGLTLPQTYRFVLLPMAFRIIIPALTNEFAAIIKNSSVALTIGLLELTAAARSMQEFSFQIFEAFTAATILYILFSILAIAASNWVERKTAVPGMITGAKASTGGH
ncbi:MAG TPA: amino acid ABC transporter permease [Burkholderiaceae bacterium]|nr:amino acid ABC transporter permease [Burkholderiaceae bacterium]